MDDDETISWVFSNQFELLNTALGLGITECSECGETFQIDMPSGIMERIRRWFSSKPYYRVNIATISNISHVDDDPQAFCSTECSVKG